MFPLGAHVLVCLHPGSRESLINWPVRDYSMCVSYRVLVDALRSRSLRAPNDAPHVARLCAVCIIVVLLRAQTESATRALAGTYSQVSVEPALRLNDNIKLKQ